LLTHHKKLNRWLQLGGHADGCSDVLAVALREVAEESGITSVEAWSPDIFDIDIHLIPERHGVKAHHHYDVRFALRVLGEESYVVSEESHDLAWIEIATIENFTDEHSILRMARKWKGRTTQRGHDLNARGIQASDSSINGFNGS
jgi:8-oxo-dGTP pyrophosphatase MutT (NUDIX family)